MRENSLTNLILAHTTNTLEKGDKNLNVTPLVMKTPTMTRVYRREGLHFKTGWV
jgi:hypothetical protein